METINQSDNTRDKEHMTKKVKHRKKKPVIRAPYLPKAFQAAVIKTLGPKILFSSTMD